MQLIDTHCHLDFPVFDQDREALLARCRALGVTEYIIPAIAEDNWTRVMALADQHDWPLLWSGRSSLVCR